MGSAGGGGEEKEKGWSNKLSPFCYRSIYESDVTLLLPHRSGGERRESREREGERNVSRRLKILGLLFFSRCVSTYYECLRTLQCSVLGRKATEREREKKPPENESESKRVFRSSTGGISIMKEGVLCRLVWKRCQRLFLKKILRPLSSQISKNELILGTFFRGCFHARISRLLKTFFSPH